METIIQSVSSLKTFEEVRVWGNPQGDALVFRARFKEACLRQAGEILVGSNPTQCN